MQISNFNTEHITNLSAQIKNSTDPDAIRVLVKQHSKQIADITNSINKEMAKISSKILPIMQLPSPTPPSIVKWIGKLVAGNAMPQLEAYISYTQHLAAASSAISDITSAISELQKVINEVNNIKGEITKELNDIIDSTLNEIGDLDSALGGALGDALSVVSDASSAMNAITGATTTFDTSSVDNFVASAGDTLTALQAEHQTFLDAVGPSIKTAPTLSGNAINGSTLTVDIGVWEGTDPITYSYQWSRDTTEISGANTATYTCQTIDIGSVLSCVVAADNVADYVEYKLTSDTVIDVPVPTV